MINENAHPSITSSLSDDELMLCRVCGWKQETAPWGGDGQTASFLICPCCGVEFGYEDSHFRGF